MSKPHFFGADKKLLKGVTGLKPNESQHEFLLKMEMVSPKNMSMIV